MDKKENKLTNSKSLNKLYKEYLTNNILNNFINFDEKKDDVLKVYSLDNEYLFNKVKNIDIIDFKKINRNDFFSSLKRKNQIILFNNDELKSETILNNLKNLNYHYLNSYNSYLTYLSYPIVTFKIENSTFNSPLFFLKANIYKEKRTYKIEIQDQPIFNKYLLNILSNKYNIVFPKYKNNINEYLKKIKQIINDKDILFNNNMYLSIFFLNKIDSYFFLENNKADIIKNNLAKSLLNLETFTYSENQTFNKNYSYSLLDDNQNDIINYINSNNNLLIDTLNTSNKIKLISNIIFNSLNYNKSILYVSNDLTDFEKINTELTKIKLNSFILELNSNNSLSIISKLKATLDLQKRISNNVNFKSYQDNSNINSLRMYYKEINIINSDINESLFNLINKYEKYNNYKDFNYQLINIKDKGKEFENSVLNNLNDYLKFVNNFNNDYHLTPYYGIKKSSINFLKSDLLKTSFYNGYLFFKYLDSIKNKIFSRYNLKINSYKEYLAFKSLSEIITSNKNLSNYIFNLDNINKLLSNIDLIIDISIKLKGIKETIKKDYKEDIFNIDCENYLKTIKESKDSLTKFFNIRYKSFIKTFSSLLLTKKKIKDDEIIKTLNILVSYKKLLNQFNYLQNDYQKMLNNYLGIYTDFTKLKLDLINLKNIYSILDFSNLNNINNYSNFIVELIELLSVMNRNDYYFSSSINEIDRYFDSNIYSFETSEINSSLNKLNKCYLNVDNINDYLYFNDILFNLKKLDILPLIDLFIQDNLNIDSYIPCFKKIYYFSWINYLISNNNYLKEFKKENYENEIIKFKENKDFYFNKLVDTLYQNLYKKIPSTFFVEDSIFSSFLNSLNSDETEMLLNNYMDIIKRITPVILTDIYSLNHYFLKMPYFDLIIIDNANKIDLIEALPLILNTKQLIVISNDKAIINNNFYEHIIYQEKYKIKPSLYNLIKPMFTNKLIKITDDYFDEKLITYSNLNFFSTTLITYPLFDNDNRYGLERKYVKGTYNESINNKEAEQVVNSIFDVINNNLYTTILIVSFTLTQSNYIQDLFFKKISNEITEKIINNSVKIIFKSIEEINNDSYQVVIISTTFDTISIMDEKNILNIEKSELLINSLSLIAKEKIILYTSIKANEIKLNDTKSLGIKYFKDYLSYFENSKVNNKQIDNNYINNSIEKVLIKNKVNYERNVSTSLVKVDFIIKDKNEKRKIMIEIDNSNKLSIVNKVILRQEIFEKYNFKYYKIYSLLWFKNKEEESRKLIDFINLNLN